MKPEGAMAAMPTPFRADGSVHRAALRKLVGFLIDRGAQGIFAASTVGEFVHLSPEQRDELVALTVEYAAGRVPVLAGAADLSPRRVVEHCRRFKRAGAEYATIAPPYYYPLGQADIVAHYREIAERIDLPFVLYNIPQFCSPMTVDTILEIVRTCGPVALKNSGPDGVEAAQILDGLKGKDVSYLVGPDELLYPSLELGARGCISGITSSVPEATRGLIDCHRRGDRGGALALHRGVLELVHLCAGVPFPYVIKLLLSVRGVELGAPLQAQSAKTRRHIESLRQPLQRKVETLVTLARKHSRAASP